MTQHNICYNINIGSYYYRTTDKLLAQVRSNSSNNCDNLASLREDFLSSRRRSIVDGIRDNHRALLAVTICLDLDSKKTELDGKLWLTRVLPFARGYSLDSSLDFVFLLLRFIAKSFVSITPDKDCPWWVEVVGETGSSIPQGDLCCVFDINHPPFLQRAS